MRSFALVWVAIGSAACNSILGIGDVSAARNTDARGPGSADAPDAPDTPDAQPDAAPPPPYTIRAYTPRLRSVAYGSGVFVAVGDAGTVLTSPDGQSWTRRALPDPTASVRQVAFGAGRFIATPGFVSTDGITWTTSQPTYSIAFVNGRFVSIGGDSLSVSPDGVSWTSHDLPTGYQLYDTIAYGNGLYLCTGYKSSGGYATFTSPDLTTWTVHPQSAYLMRFGFVGGVFVDAYGDQLLTSTDGAQWSQYVDGGARFETMLSLGDQLLVAGEGGSVALTRDGTMATTTNYQAGVQDLWGAATDGSVIVAVGDAIVRSTDGGKTWATVSATPSSNMLAIAASDGTAGAADFVAVGTKGRILTTFDGTDWHDTGFVDDPEDLHAVAYGNGRWVICGDGHAYTSTTGETWVSHTPGCGTTLAFLNGTFYTLSGTSVLSSTDGVTWTFVAAAPSDVYALQASGGLLFSTWADGISTSTDGTSWTLHAVPNTPTDPTRFGWWQVVRGNGLFGATDNGAGYLARSSDGQSWIATQLDPVGCGPMMVFDGAQFVLQCQDSSGYALYTSTDLEHVTRLASFSPSISLMGWAWNSTVTPGRTAAIGDQGLVMTMP